MKTVYLVLIILLLHCVAYTQNSDLIVTTDGDSIACKIEQVTDSVIYFRMITNNKWVKSNYNTRQIADTS